MIEVFADIWCPFAYVGLVQLRAARDELAPSLPIVVSAWPLEVINGTPLDPGTVADEVADLRAQVAPELFTGLDPGHFPTTTIPALGLVAAAREQAPTVGETVGMTLRRWLFEEGRDISDPDVLAEAAGAAAVEMPSAAWARAAVEAEHALGRARGVKGSPHFFVGDAESFCPTLRIARAGAHLQITMDRDRMRSWLSGCLGTDRPAAGSAPSPPV